MPGSLFVLGIFISVVVAVVLWLRLRSVEAENRGIKLELAGVREEIQAVRKAFLRRISALEDAAAPPPEHETPPAAEPVPETPPAAAEPPVAARAPDALPPPASAAPQPRGKLKRIDWEQWVGVRGAAVLGACVLGLAGILFLQYSIESGLLSPEIRVALSSLLGAASVAGSEWLRKKNYSRQGPTRWPAEASSFSTRQPGRRTCSTD